MLADLKRAVAEGAYKYEDFFAERPRPVIVCNRKSARHLVETLISDIYLLTLLFTPDSTEYNNMKIEL
jgi:hypothetical protein